MAIRRRPIRSGPDGLTALEVRFLTPLAGSEASARDVRVSALGRLSVTVGDSSRDGDWLQQRPGQVFRYLLAWRSGRSAPRRSPARCGPNAALRRSPTSGTASSSCVSSWPSAAILAGSLMVRDAAGYGIDLRRVSSTSTYSRRRRRLVSPLSDAARSPPPRPCSERRSRSTAASSSPTTRTPTGRSASASTCGRSPGKGLAALAQIALVRRAARRGGRAPAAARRARAVRLARPPDAHRGLLAPRPPHRGAAPLPRPACSAAPSVRRAAGLRAHEPRGGARRAASRGRGRPRAAGRRLRLWNL